MGAFDVDGNCVGAGDSVGTLVTTVANDDGSSVALGKAEKLEMGDIEGRIRGVVAFCCWRTGTVVGESDVLPDKELTNRQKWSNTKGDIFAKGIILHELLFCIARSELAYIVPMESGQQ